MDAANRQMAAQYNQFNQSQQMRQKQHEDFLAVMQRGTDMSMNRTGEAMNARSRAADDWCDYSLDQQKRLDPNTGLITKDSSAYNYTWVNEQATGCRRIISTRIRMEMGAATGRCRRMSAERQ